MHVRRVVAAAAAAATLLLAVAPGSASARTAPTATATQGPRGAQRTLAAELDDYWTPARMARAESAAPHAGDTTGHAGRRLLAPRSSSHRFEGIKEVGTFFWASGNDNYRFCGGTVVTSPGKNIVVSAAHCFDDDDAKRRLVFVPKHHKSDPKPYGVFPIEVGQIYMDPAYLKKNGQLNATDLDFAFLRTGPRSDGKKLEDVVGGFPLALNAGFGQENTRVIGYPSDTPQDPLDCLTTLKKFTTGDVTDSGGRTWKGGTFPQVDCDGYVGGTSGGPFLIPRPGGGRAVAGVIGGWQTGGHSADTSYSSYFDDDTKRIYDAAVAGKQPAPQPGSSVLGKGSTWKHARQIASGYFTTDDHNAYEYMDMFVLWDDGELTLYRGAGEKKGWFDKEIKLKDPNRLWKDHAVEIAAGDFTGDDDSDLIVRWSDGELTLYPSVDEHGFHGEVQLKPPNDLWKNHARAMTAGRFSGNKWQDDLVVAWSDGELTLYQDVSARGLGTEHKLLSPNGTWTHVTELSSGDWSSKDTWDLIVRWSDGEVTNYANLTASNPPGNASERRVRPPNDLWKHATVITGGDYTENPWPDDTIVRWSDGELSLYENGDDARLGKEHMLVAPDN